MYGVRGEAGMTTTNSKDKQKPLVLYPLSLNPLLKSLDNQVILDSLKKDNIFDNVQEFLDRGIRSSYSIIADSIYNGYLNGRFVKLKSDNIETIDKKTKQEDLEVIGPDKYIEANSYFIWDTKNNLMVAQWNRDSLNVLTKKSSSILSNSLKKHKIINIDVELQPFPSEELIKYILQNKGNIHKYFLKFNQLSKPYFEQAGIDSGITDTLIWDIANRESIGLSLTIKLDNPLTLTQAILDKLKNIANKNKKIQTRFGVYTDEGNFDLIGDKYVYYTEYVNTGTNLQEYRENVYKAINDIYAKERDTIFPMRKEPSINDIEKYH